MESTTIKDNLSALLGKTFVAMVILPNGSYSVNLSDMMLKLVKASFNKVKVRHHILVIT